MAGGDGNLPSVMSLVRAAERCSVLGPALYGAEQHSPPISSQLSLLGSVRPLRDRAGAVMSSLRFASVSFGLGGGG